MWFLRNVVRVRLCISIIRQVHCIYKSASVEEGIHRSVGGRVVGCGIINIFVRRWVRIVGSIEGSWRYVWDIIRCVHRSQASKSGRIVGIGRCMAGAVMWLTMGRMIYATMGMLVVMLWCRLSESDHLEHGVGVFVGI